MRQQTRTRLNDCQEAELYLKTVAILLHKIAHRETDAIADRVATIAEDVRLFAGMLELAEAVDQATSTEDNET